jgi:hypothetical protein
MLSRHAQVIMVCSSEASVAAEMELLHAVQSTVAEAGHAHVMVYAADPASSSLEVGHPQVPHQTSLCIMPPPVMYMF